MIELDLRPEQPGTGQLTNFIPHKTMEARLDITIFVKVPEFYDKNESQEAALDVLLAIDRCIEHIGALTKLHNLKLTPHIKGGNK